MRALGASWDAYKSSKGPWGPLVGHCNWPVASLLLSWVWSCGCVCRCCCQSLCRPGSGRDHPACHATRQARGRGLHDAGTPCARRFPPSRHLSMGFSPSTKAQLVKAVGAGQAGPNHPHAPHGGQRHACMGFGPQLLVPYSCCPGPNRGACMMSLLGTTRPGPRPHPTMPLSAVMLDDSCPKYAGHPP